ncbi:MAG TPA: fibronectin type III domain-containing protein, partial [Thermoanaerobaculia bacterium]
MRILFFVLSIACLASSARSAIGPEHRLAARFPAMAGIGFDGDFVVAYVQRGAADQRGLYVQWIKTNGALAASPIRLTTTEPDRVQIIGNPAETAVFWRGCDTGGRCGLFVAWLVNSVPIGEATFLGEEYVSAAASPRGDGTIFVVGSDRLRDIRLAALPPRGTALSESRVVVTEPHDDYLTGAYVGNPTLVSNGREMLLGWTQFYRGSIPLFPGSSSHETRLKVRRLDESGDPVGPLTALPYQLWELAADGDDRFVIVGTRYPYRSWFLTPVVNGVVGPGIPYLRGSLCATVAGDGHQVFALHGTSFLMVTEDGVNSSYALAADSELRHGRGLIARGGANLLVAYELIASDNDPTRARIGYRIIDMQPFPMLPPAPQVRVTVSGSDPTIAHVEWDPVEAASSYRLRTHPVDSDDADFYSDVKRLAPDVHQATVPLPLGDTTYAIDVSVSTPVGISPSSVPVLVRTERGAIRMPFNVTAEVGPERTVTLRWTDPSSRETGFEIRLGWEIETLKRLPPNTTETTLTLPESGVYALHVVAMDGDY